MEKIVLIMYLFLSLGVRPILAVTKIEPTSLATVSAEADLTAPKEEQNRLINLMKSHKENGWWVTNSLKLGIRKAVADGVSPNTLVLLFLFPLVAALVAFSRQVIGVSGFGMIVPALLSVAFLSTGGLVGLVLLAFILWLPPWEG